MDIQIDQIEEIMIVKLIGELNQRTASPLEKELIPLIHPDCKVLLDMKELTFLSSAGLRILLLLYRQITNHNGNVALTNLSEMVEDTMSITGFLTFFTAYKSNEQGITALRHPRSN
ncbi:MAG: STAS domain-containing protein [Chloroflexi bacterium]|nr:STAS domain-containing protein [Chloroflexota bacterium]